SRFRLSLALLDLHSFPTRRSSDLVVVHEHERSARLERLECVEDGRVLLTRRNDANDEYAITHDYGLSGIGIGCVSDEQARDALRSEEHTSELQSREKLVCTLLLEK